MTRFFVILLLLASGPFALARNDSINNYKVESIGALTDANVPEAVRNALESKGLRVLDDKSKPVCEIWFSKNIPGNKVEVSGASFGKLGEGTFVGVINFPANAGDFRGQGIKAGFYTLRYGLILQDGNHLGVSPARDFLLACPVAEDKNPANQLNSEELIKLSRIAAGTGHPSVWSMVPATSNDGLPRAITNEHEHVILEAKIPTKAGDMAVGLIVVGKTEG